MQKSRKSYYEKTVSDYSFSTFMFAYNSQELLKIYILTQADEGYDPGTSVGLHFSKFRFFFSVFHPDWCMRLDRLLLRGS